MIKKVLKAKITKFVNLITRKNLLNELIDKITDEDDLIFYTKNYKMADFFDTENLVVGRLEQVVCKDIGPTVITTSQVYIFEPIIVNGEIKYQEVFTGFIAGDTKSGYFRLPYVIDIKKLTDVLEDTQAKIPKFGMLLTLNDVNSRLANKGNKNKPNNKKRRKV